MKKQTPESSVLKACLDYLAAVHIWRTRMNTGAMQVGNRFVRFGKNGTADILATPWKEGRQRILWVEAKALKGKQSEAQKDFQAEVETAGHDYVLVRDLDDLIGWLNG